MSIGFRNVRVLTIEWGDCDPAGIIFYPSYFAMFDASTWALLTAALDCGAAEIRERFGIVGFPMVDTRATFQAPVRFGDRVSVTSRVEAVKRSSFTVLHELHREDGTLAVTGWETRVWATTRADDPHALVGLAVPDDVRAALLDPLRQE